MKDIGVMPFKIKRELRFSEYWKMQHVLMLSYGKDSLACLYAIKELSLPLDRIVHSEIWATEKIPAELPEMIAFKKKADEWILRHFNIAVEHMRSEWTFESRFYSKTTDKCKDGYANRIRGFPLTFGSWCARDLKISACPDGKDITKYLGIAADEYRRIPQERNEGTVLPLVEMGMTEVQAKKWCVENDLLSPIYTSSSRGGCWFCPKQPIGELRKIFKEHHDLWEMLLRWDNDSPVTFRADGHTVHDLDARFKYEVNGKPFRWKDVLGR